MRVPVRKRLKPGQMLTVNSLTLVSSGIAAIEVDFLIFFGVVEQQLVIGVIRCK
jgi:hypothetical protein